MKMDKPLNYDSEQAATGEYKIFPAGGYVCKILGAKVEQSQSGREMLVLRMDVAEGDYKNYFTQLWEEKVQTNKDAKWGCVYRQLTDGDSTKFFKGMIVAIEKSNPKYQWNWEESSLKNKLVGAIFGVEEFESNKDGSILKSSKIKWLRSVESIRKGDFTIPEIKRLDMSAANAFGGHDVAPDEEINF